MLTLFRTKKHIKMQWLQHPDNSNVDNPNNVRREAGRLFRNKNN
jgi:hypothetical protein